MKTNDIKKMLHAFYNGESSKEQEQILLHYFESEDVAEEFLPEKDFFLSLYVSAEEIEIPENLESKLSGMIDLLAQKEVSAENVKNQEKIKRGRGRIWATIGAVACAASVGLAFYLNTDSTVSNGNIGHLQTQQPKDTYTNPEEAYIATQKALMLVSSNLNTGLIEVSNVLSQDGNK